MITLIIGLLIVEFIIFNILQEEHEFFAFLSLIGASAVYHFLIDNSLFPFIFLAIKTNPLVIIPYFGIYLGIGLTYSLWMWWRFVRKSVKQGATKRQVAGQKGRIVEWMMYWPVSSPWYLVRNILGDIYFWIYTNIAHIYDKILDNEFDKTEKDGKVH